MPVTLSEIIMQRPENGNTLRVRERHTLHNGEVRVKSYLATTGTDLNAQMANHASKLGSSLKEQEYQDYIERIRNGENPFRDAQNNPVDPVESTRDEMLEKVLTYVLSLPLTEENFYIITRGVTFLSNLTDAQMIALLSIDQAKVDEIRSKATDIQAIKTIVQGYVPPLGGE